MVGNAVVRPRGVVEVLDLPGVVIASNLECPNHKVCCMFSVRQRHPNVTVVPFFTRRLRPVQLTLWLSTSQYKAAISRFS